MKELPMKMSQACSKDLKSSQKNIAINAKDGDSDSTGFLFLHDGVKSLTLSEEVYCLCFIASALLPLLCCLPLILGRSIEVGL
jgi:hypothetical protein